MKISRVLICFLVAWSQALWAASPEATYADHGIVASRSEPASQVGADIMRQGGNAVDAAVATAFALAVTYPSAGNIGGGGFAVIRLPDGEVVALDHREKAPAAAHRDMFLDENGDPVPGLSTSSHMASGVPGSVDGLLVMLEKYGTMNRKEVLAPAIKLARKGFPLDHDLVRQFKRRLPSMEKYPASVAVFTRDDGAHYEVGDIWRQPDLANTLERIAAKGRDGFYKGKTAELIVAEMERGGGIISMQDLADYHSVWREPVKGTYRGYEIYGMPPPSSGGILVQQILNMLEPHDLGALGWGNSETIHLMIEAERRAYADRAEYLGDPDYYEVPAKILTSKDYARQRFATFDKDKATPSEEVGAGTWGNESLETTHFSVYKDGMMVAFTTTINSGYGNKIVVPGAGFLLNNEMDDFSIKENTPNQFNVIGRAANAIEPGKRMLSSMSPTVVTKDGEPFLITGSPGGSTIITTTLQVILNTIDHEMPIDDAVSLPRFHHQWKPNRIYYDGYAFSPDTLEALKRKGHQSFVKSRFGRGIGDANSILIKDGVISGSSDPRGAGAAIGY
jgi:gamma-glutamyltranspeptidase/glutathione hydrolase